MLITEWSVVDIVLLTRWARWEFGLGVCAVNCFGTVCAWDCAEIRMDPDSKYILRKVVLDFVCLFVGMELLIRFCNCRS